MRAKQQWLLGLLSILLFYTTVANATMSIDQAVQKAYYEWCHAIGHAKGDVSHVTEFYAPDAILIPTLSADFLVNREGGLDHYFKFLTSLPHIKCTPLTLITHVHGDVATNSGTYKFIYDENNKKHAVPARFTFVYKKIHDKWMIIVHHSSKMPE